MLPMTVVVKPLKARIPAVSPLQMEKQKILEKETVDYQTLIDDFLIVKLKEQITTTQLYVSQVSCVRENSIGSSITVEVSF